MPRRTCWARGAGRGGKTVVPVLDLPPKPWRELPILRYGDGKTRVRLLCGYLKCDALNFGPLREALPKMIHVRTATGTRAAWLGATLRQIVADPRGRCLARIHDDPRRDWSVQDLTDASGLSRSTLAERFEKVLDTSPMRYVRDRRLYLASVALGTTRRAVAAVAHEAGYGTEAAFNRAFSRAYGMPPATWRQRGRT